MLLFLFSSRSFLASVVSFTDPTLRFKRSLFVSISFLLSTLILSFFKNEFRFLIKFDCGLNLAGQKNNVNRLYNPEKQFFASGLNLEE